MSRYDLLVLGEINPDLILRGDVEPEFGQAEQLVEHATLTVGSSNVIFACAAAKLSLRVAFVGWVGDDLFGRFMLSEMRACGIDTTFVRVHPEGRTGFSVILQPRQGERAILTYPGLIAALRAEDVPERAWAHARHVHVGSFFLQTALQPSLPALFARVRQQGRTTSLDPNDAPQGRWEALWPVLAHTDVFLPNAREAQALTRTASADAAARRLAHPERLVAIKLGAQGALAVQGNRYLRAVPPRVSVVDTVGAGDTFDAGLLYGWLQGWPLSRALALGVVCGALSTRAAGGTAAQPSLDEALRWLPQVEVFEDVAPNGPEEVA
ncbi:MAG: carbohydrate kinase family protein [Chloroflexi bacterium]|nr:carbohydrate kinase family protein [Chloroflexota bacterium]